LPLILDRLSIVSFDFSYIRVTGNYLIYIDLTPVPFYVDKVEN